MEMAVEKFASVIIVTLVYVLLYYLFLLNVLRAKVLVLRQCKERGEKFNRYENDYPELRAADRIQLNMLEHMPTFLVALWLHAVFVSVVSATWLGGIYVFIRATYPLFLGTSLTKNIPMRLLINTFSGYFIHLVMVFWTGWVALSHLF